MSSLTTLTSLTPVMNLSELLAQTARLFPDLTALVQGESSTTWSQMNGRVDAMVRALRSIGLKKGDKIVVLSRNNLQLFESCWVAFRMGCVWVPTNFRLTPPELAYLAESSHAVAMIVESQFYLHISEAKRGSRHLKHIIEIGSKAKDDHFGYEDLIQQYSTDLEQSPPLQPSESETVAYDDPLWYFYTSGTTGKPKAAVLTHGQMAFVVNNHLADLIPGTNQHDRSIAVAALSHGAGIHALLNVARGAATVLMPSEKLDPELFWQLVQRHRISNLFTVPTIVKMLVEHPSVDLYDHSSLRFVIYAGAPMYRSDQVLALNKLGNVLVQYFGLGEVTGCITVLPADMHSADDLDPNANIGSCGRPRTGMEIAILDAQSKPLLTGEIGEICCKGPAIFSGYYNDAVATAKTMRGGWFHTGDLGKLDSAGLLYITGRESDMYISGGSNVYPKEVEEILLTHPRIAEVAVIGVRDKKWGESGVAVVVLKAGLDPIDAAQLLNHLDGKCAKYRWPRQFIFWDSLPKSGYGKITKKDIKKTLLETGQVQEFN